MSTPLYERVAVTGARAPLMTALLPPVLFIAFMTGVQAQVPDGYYDTVDDADAATLRASLHAVIDDHQRFPYTSSQTDTWDVLEEAQRDPADDSRIITLYRNNSFARRGGGNENYNREHVWPRSYGFTDNDGASLNYPFTDMHALWLSDEEYNFQRSNKPFEDCDASCAEWPTEANEGRGGNGGPWPGDSNWTDGEFTQGRWEVWQGRRGDVARAIFYMDLRYEGGSHGVTGAAEPDLRLTNDRALIDSGRSSSNEPVAWMGLLDTLLAWHLEDPPDESERRRHEVVAANQGNRNPFIDRPEWVACVYLEDCGFQINAGLNDAWFDPATSGQGFFFNVYPDIGQLFLAHFTFDAERPPADLAAIVGEPGHRWLTAIGPIEGNRVSLEITLTRGGLFDDGTPVESTTPYGSYELEFHDCASATLQYSIPGAELAGTIELQRVVKDNEALCEALSSGASASGSAVTTSRKGPPATGASGG